MKISVRSLIVDYLDRWPFVCCVGCVPPLALLVRLWAGGGLVVEMPRGRAVVCALLGTGDTDG